MKAARKKLIGALTVFVIASLGAVIVTARAVRTEVDPSIAAVRQNFTCQKCGFLFPLTQSDAVAMRRQKGNIVCPKCGGLGASGEAAATNNELVGLGASPSRDSEEADDEHPRPRKPGEIPRVGLSKKEGARP